MTAFNFADRVKDTASSVSGSTVTLAGSPPTGFQSFASGIGNNNYCAYCLTDTSGNWEVSYGQLTGSTSLARASTPLASSNSGSQVSSFSGTVTAFVVDPAALLGSLSNNDTGVINYYSNAYASGSAGTFQPVVGTVYYTPVMIGQPMSACKLGVDVTALYSGTSTLLLGLYSTAPGVGPAALLCSNTGAAFNTGTGGSTGANLTGTLTPSKVQMPGLYAVGILALSNKPTLETLATSALSTARTILGAASASDTSMSTGWVDSVTGQTGLPSTPSPALDTHAIMVALQASF